MSNGTPGFIKERLTQAREMKGLTITNLAMLLQVHRQTVQQYESGTRTPAIDILNAISIQLSMPVDFFFKTNYDHLEKGTVFYRSLKRATKEARMAAEIHLLYFREIVSYGSQYIKAPKLNLPVNINKEIEFPDITRPMVEELASQLRTCWSLSDKPINNLTRVLEHNGFFISKLPLDSDHLSGLSLWGKPEERPFILINSENRSAARSRYDLAHELGHMVLHRYVKQKVHDKSEHHKLIEDQAYGFAAAFLLPKEPFLRDVGSATLDHFRMIKPRWKVSIKAMIKRCASLGVISPEKEAELYIQYNKRGWNKVEPYDELMEVEIPTLVRKMFELMVERGIESSEQIENALAFRPEYICMITGLPMNFFEHAQPELKTIKFVPKFKAK